MMSDNGITAEDEHVLSREEGGDDEVRAGPPYSDSSQRFLSWATTCCVFSRVSS